MRRCVIVCLLVCLSAAVFAVPARTVPDTRPADDAGFYVQGWFSGTPPDPLVPRQWGLSRLAAPEARARAGSGPVVVAVLDTGIDLSHPEFAGRVVAGPDFVDGGTVSGDPNGHGTHVAGIVAAAVDGSGVEGLAPGMVLLAVRVLDETGYGDDAWVAAGVDWAVDAGVDVINLSLGSDVDHPGLRPAVARAVAADVVVVAAAGNDGPAAEPMFPAALPGVLTVSASDPADFPPLFSASGSHVDLLAPGAAIFSTIPDGGFGWMSGTSQSAPFVSAAAGLLLATFPEWSAAAVRSVLVSSAFPAPDGTGAGFGFGVVDPVASLGGPPTPPGLSVSVPGIIWELPGCCLLPEVGAGPAVPVLPDVPPPFLPVLPPLTVPVLPPSEPWVPPSWLPVWPPEPDMPALPDAAPEPVVPAEFGVPSVSDAAPGPGLSTEPDVAPSPELSVPATAPVVWAQPACPPGPDVSVSPETVDNRPPPAFPPLSLPRVAVPVPPVQLNPPTLPPPVQLNPPTLPPPVTFPPLVMSAPSPPVTFPPLVMSAPSPPVVFRPVSRVSFPPLVMFGLALPHGTDDLAFPD